MNILDITLKSLSIGAFLFSAYPLVAFSIFCILQQSSQTIITLGTKNHPTGDTHKFHQWLNQAMQQDFIKLAIKQGANSRELERLLYSAYFQGASLPKSSSYQDWYNGSCIPPQTHMNKTTKVATTKIKKYEIGIAENLLIQVHHHPSQRLGHVMLGIQVGSQYRLKITLPVIFTLTLTMLIPALMLLPFTAYTLPTLAILLVATCFIDKKSSVVGFIGHDPISPRSHLKWDDHSQSYLYRLLSLIGVKNLGPEIKYNIGTVFMNGFINALMFYGLFCIGITSINVFSLMNPIAVGIMLGITAIDRLYMLCQRYQFFNISETYRQETTTAQPNGTTSRIYRSYGPGLYFPTSLCSIVRPCHAKLARIVGPTSLFSL